MKKLFIRTNWNQDISPESEGEINDEPSMTQPDQTMSMAEILRRYASGIPMDSIAKIPIYEGDDDEMPDVRTLDLADIEAIKDANQADLLILQEKAKNEAENAAKAIADKQRKQMRVFDEEEPLDNPPTRKERKNTQPTDNQSVEEK